MYLCLPTATAPAVGLQNRILTAHATVVKTGTSPQNRPRINHSTTQETTSQSAKCKYQNAKCPEEESGVKAEAAEKSNVAPVLTPPGFGQTPDVPTASGHFDLWYLHFELHVLRALYYKATASSLSRRCSLFCSCFVYFVSSWQTPLRSILHFAICILHFDLHVLRALRALWFHVGFVGTAGTCTRQVGWYNPSAVKDAGDGPLPMEASSCCAPSLTGARASGQVRSPRGDRAGGTFDNEPAATAATGPGLPLRQMADYLARTTRQKERY